MSRPCDSCTDSTSAKERNREMDVIRAQAKQKANEETKAQAICRDEISGLFFTSAERAITEQLFIVEFVSAI